MKLRARNNIILRYSTITLNTLLSNRVQAHFDVSNVAKSYYIHIIVKIVSKTLVTGINDQEKTSRVNEPSFKIINRSHALIGADTLQQTYRLTPCRQNLINQY